MQKWVRRLDCGGYRVTALTILSLVTRVQAQAIDFDGALGDIPDTLCNFTGFAANAIGLAVVAGSIVAGLLLLGTQRRNGGGLGWIVTGFIVGITLLALPELLATFGDDACVAELG